MRRIRTLALVALLAGLALPNSALAGKKKQELSVILDGDEVIVIQDGEKVKNPRVKRAGNQVIILDEEGHALFTMPTGSGTHVRTSYGSHNQGLRIGVWLDRVDEALATQLGLHKGEGILVSRVRDDSPAMRGGLKRYDIVTSVAGEPVRGMDSIRTALASMEEGDHLAMEVLRGGKTVKLDLVPEVGDVHYSRSSVFDPSELPSVFFVPEEDGDAAVIEERAEKALEAYEKAAEAYAEEMERRLEEMERRLEEMERVRERGD